MMNENILLYIICVLSLALFLLAIITVIEKEKNKIIKEKLRKREYELEYANNEREKRITDIHDARKQVSEYAEKVWDIKKMISILSEAGIEIRRVDPFIHDSSSKETYMVNIRGLERNSESSLVEYYAGQE